MKKVEVYGTITLPVSIVVDSSDESNGMYVAENLLNSYNINSINLDLDLIDGRKIKVKVHDAELSWEDAEIKGE